MLQGLQTLGNGVNSTTGIKYKRDSTKSVDVGVGAIDLNFTKFYKLNSFREEILIQN